MNWPVVLGIALAEARTLRRQLRFGFFVALALFTCVSSYLYYSVIHGLFSPLSGTLGVTSPRYVAVALGVFYLSVFLVGAVFLAFDTRIRDEICQMADVLDSRPVDNLEWILGRFLGLLIPSWLAALAAGVVLQVLGSVARGLDWPIGEPLHAASLVGFVVFMALPALSFFLAYVQLLSVLVVNRLLTAVLALATLAGLLWASWQLPAWAAPGVDLLGSFAVSAPSDLTPSVIGPGGLLQRLAWILVGVALLALAAVFHPRRDGSGRRRTATVAGLLLALGLGLLATSSLRGLQGEARKDQWRQSHAAEAETPAPDVVAVRGHVVIEPGQALQLALELEITAPSGSSLDSALFSFNPGFEVTSIGAAGEALEYSWRDGLLTVQLSDPLSSGQTTRLELEATGAPDLDFALLDPRADPARLPAFHPRRVLLGTEPSYFERGYVALLPSLRWLPAAGAADLDEGRRDFFRIDLEVEVPEGWLVGGPGLRQTASASAAGATRFRFAPSAPVPEAALLSARFDRRASRVRGVELEILTHPEHSRNLELFEPAKDAILHWVEERLLEAEQFGVAYPYGALTVVEVPRQLRTYGGGWALRSAMAPPSLLLVRESDFPAARFDSVFRNASRFAESEGGLAGAQRRALEEFFEADISGSNLFEGAAANFFRYQTAASGPRALALDALMHDIAQRLLFDKQGYFSAYALGTDVSTLLGVSIGHYSLGDRSLIEAILDAATDRPEVWERALGVALADLEPTSDPETTLDVLTLKGQAVARWLIDELGRRRTGELLATLREAHRGAAFDLADVLDAADSVGADLEQLATDWLDHTALPGFVTSSARLVRLRDDDQGSPRYQLSLDVRNGELVPGLLRLRFQLEEDGPWQETDAFRVAGQETVELGIVTSSPPVRLEVAPYLSLNRKPFPVRVPRPAESDRVELPPFSGMRPSPWRPADDGAVVVDDLDEGFVIEGDDAVADRAGQTLDGGLPVHQFGRPPESWHRQEASSAWGRYRHTSAVVRTDPKGSSRAVFVARVPRAGRWRLELHLPGAFAGSSRFADDWRMGTFAVTVVQGGSSLDGYAFDADVALAGWNALGELELEAGELRVELSNRGSGGAVIADAIRLLPLGVNAEAAAAEGAGAEADGR